MKFSSEQFLMGVNYWPGHKAISFWRDFDIGEVREDFAICAELGLNVLRLFLLWDDWQPEPDRVDSACLEHFEKVCDAAQANQLGLDVTFFTGHMSGPNWPPRWLLNPSAPVNRDNRPIAIGQEYVDSSYNNPFADEIAIDAEKLLLKTVVGAFHKHPAIWLWNLGNEPDLFAWPPDHQTGQRWVQQMTETIRNIDTEHLVTVGLHIASLLDDNGFRLNEAYAETDIGVMHAYPIFIPQLKHPLDSHFVPFTCALASALANKPILMEEWGGCTAGIGEPSQLWDYTIHGQTRQIYMASEADLANYVAAVLLELHTVGATGAMLWTFADYSPETWDRPFCNVWRYERNFGMIRADGSLKPHAEVFRQFARQHPAINPQPRRVELTVTPDEYYSDPNRYFWPLYEAYCASFATN